MAPRETPPAPTPQLARKPDAPRPSELLAAGVLVPAPVESWLELLLDRVEAAR
jgi:hypothetical protein